MDTEYIRIRKLIRKNSFVPTCWYDYYTMWSAVLFFVTIIMLIIDQFHEFLPGWWIAFVFANSVFVGIIGTLIVTINIDHVYNQDARNRLDGAFSQLFWHTIPMLIVVFLLLLFPSILKDFEVWEVAVAFAVFIMVYLCFPQSSNKCMFQNKIRTVYFDPNMYLSLVSGISVIALMVFTEKKIVERES